MTGGTVYHMVCRECPTESLRKSADGAEEFAITHADGTDHRVAVARIE